MNEKRTERDGGSVHEHPECVIGQIRATVLRKGGTLGTSGEMRLVFDRSDPAAVAFVVCPENGMPEAATFAFDALLIALQRDGERVGTGEVYCRRLSGSFLIVVVDNEIGDTTTVCSEIFIREFVSRARGISGDRLEQSEHYSRAIEAEWDAISVAGEWPVSTA